MDEQLIIQEVLRGNSSKFQLIVEKHQLMIFKTCMGFVHHHEDAEDLTQEVFLKAYQSLNLFKGDSAFGTWLYRIAINHSLTFLRKRKTKNLIQSVEDFFGINNSDTETPESLTIEDERKKIIRDAVDSLSENQKIAFTLSKYDDMKQSEIAEIMMISEGAVESLLQRAKNNLQKKLVQHRNKKRITRRN